MTDEPRIVAVEVVTDSATIQKHPDATHVRVVLKGGGADGSKGYALIEWLAVESRTNEQSHAHAQED